MPGLHSQPIKSDLGSSAGEEDFTELPGDLDVRPSWGHDSEEGQAQSIFSAW
jgi:hypothetical protein